MIKEVIFDLETKRLFSDIDGTDPADLGVSILSLYRRVLDNNLDEIEGAMESFWEKEFDKMWPIFQSADRIIGFNSKKFDVAALSPYADFPFAKLAHFDIFEKVKGIVGKRISLDSLAKATLEKEKTASGIAAVEYWNKGDKESLDKLEKYCKMDVAITKDLYDYGIKNGQLKYTDKWNSLRIIKVNFSYPKQESLLQQNKLF